MYIDAGFDDYLTKPMDTNRLESMLLKYLSQDLVSQGKDAAETKNKADTVHSIVVVNDDVEFLKKIKARLTDRYKVVLVKSEEQALAYLQKQEAVDIERSEHE